MTATLSDTFNKTVGNKRQSAPFSLRVTFNERKWLDKMAGDMPWGAFIRAKLFGERADNRTLHQRRPGVDQRALAQALAIIGESRIAANLNQLAKAANFGALPVDDEVEQDIKDACQAICVMGYELLSALGA